MTYCILIPSIPNSTAFIHENKHLEIPFKYVGLYNRMLNVQCN